MPAKFMDEEEVKRLLLDQENIFEDRLVFGPAPCPLCGGVMIFRFDAEVKAELRECVACGHAIDPKSGVILRLGSPERTKEVDINLATIIQPSKGSVDPR